MRATIAILASGSVTTAEAFIRAGATSAIDTHVGLIICNNKKAGIFARIEALNKELGLTIDTLLINSKTHPTDQLTAPGSQTPAEEAAIMKVLREGSFDAIALMGYMKKVGPRLVHAFGWRPDYRDPRQAKMINTHPGLLPETKGLYGVRVQEHVLQKGLSYSGQTLHVVAKDYDDGPVIAEHKVPVQPDDTPESLFSRVRDIEKKFLPQDIDAFIKARRSFSQEEEKA